MLEGTVRIGVDKSIPGFANRLTQIPGITQVTANESGYTIAGGPLGAVVARIAGLCSEMKIELTTLDAAEPNLEKVFLHLTGRGLRD
jgi:ABC-2 type transport system ATP-binding protein